MHRTINAAVTTFVVICVVGFSVGCKSHEAESSGLHATAAEGMSAGERHYFKGGIETDKGYFEYLSFSTGLEIGAPAAALVEKYRTKPAKQMMMSMQPGGSAGPTSAPSGDLPWIILPDGWIYLVGDMPCVATESGYACAEGSTLIVERNVMREGKICDRFIMLRTHRRKSGKVTAFMHGENKEKKFKGKGASYIDVPIDGSAPFDADSFDDDDDTDNPTQQAPPGSARTLADIRAARKLNRVP